MSSEALWLFSLIVGPFVVAGYSAWLWRRRTARRFWRESGITLLGLVLLAVAVPVASWPTPNGSEDGVTTWTWPVAYVAIVLLTWMIARRFPVVSTIVAGLAGMWLVFMGLLMAM